MVQASVSDCSKLALGCSRTAARQTSPSMSSPRGLASTRWRTTGPSSAWRSRLSLSLLMRRSSMAAPRQQDLGGKHGGSDHLVGAIECLAHPHGCDGLRPEFIQVCGGPPERLAQAGFEFGRRQHQGLDGVGGLLWSPSIEPAPRAIVALALLEPGKGRLAEVGCQREEREDGVGGGIEGGTMPLVDPVVAVYARVAQVLDDFLLDDVLAGERRDRLQDFKNVGVGRDRGV